LLALSFAGCDLRPTTRRFTLVTRSLHSPKPHQPSEYSAALDRAYTLTRARPPPTSTDNNLCIVKATPTKTRLFKVIWEQALRGRPFQSRRAQSFNQICQVAPMSTPIYCAMGTTPFTPPNGSSIGSAVFAELVPNSLCTLHCDVLPLSSQTAPSLVRSGPHLIHAFLYTWIHPTHHPKRNLGRVSRFSPRRTLVTSGRTDRQTNRPNDRTKTKTDLYNRPLTIYPREWRGLKTGQPKKDYTQRCCRIL